MDPIPNPQHCELANIDNIIITFAPLGRARKSSEVGGGGPAPGLPTGTPDRLGQNWMKQDGNKILGMAERDHEVQEVFHSHSLAAGDIIYSIFY